MLRVWVCALSLLASVAYAQDSAPPVGQALVLTTAYGTPFDAYINGPTDAKQAVLLLHDRFGLNGQAHDWVDRFAGMGYRALAIDLYDGRHGNSWKHATSIMHAIDPVWADSDISAALDYLKKGESDRKVVIVGWDYGATQAMQATLRDPTTVAATIAYYPTHLETKPQLVQSIVNPVLIVVADRDQELSAGQVFAFKDALSKVRTHLDVTGLEADRGFIDPASRHYDAAATSKAWDLTQKFLARYLAN